MSDLLNCPFCGGEARVARAGHAPDVVECIACGVHTDPDLWNRRARASQVDGRYWLIFFEDASRAPEVFSDEAAARYRYAQCLVSWSCHLFIQVSPGEQKKAAAQEQGDGVSDTPRTDALCKQCIEECTLHGEPLWTEAMLSEDPFACLARALERDLATAQKRQKKLAACLISISEYTGVGPHTTPWQSIVASLGNKARATLAEVFSEIPARMP